MAVPGSPAVPSVEYYEEYDIDQMPDGHRDILPLQHLALSVGVARPVCKDEIKRQPKAQAALQLEWGRLRALRCWDGDKVVEWSTVAQKARKGAATCHVGRIFSLCHEKNSELAPDDPRRKFKRTRRLSRESGSGPKLEYCSVPGTQQLSGSDGGRESR